MPVTPMPGETDDTYGLAERVLPVLGSGEIAFPDLVRVPFNPGNMGVSTTGAGGAANGSYSQALVGSNPDGSDSGFSISMPAIALASPPFNSVRIFVPFWGSTFGVRWRLDAGVTNLTNFTVTVDGDAVGVDTTWPPGPYPTLSGFNIVANEAMAITHRNLATTGMHMAEIQVNGPNTGANTVIVFHGFLASKNAGYVELPRLSAMPTAATSLTASLTEIDTSRTNVQQAARAIRKVYYVNTSASAVVVEIAYNSVVFKRLYLGATGAVPSAAAPTGDSAEWDPGSAIGIGVASGGASLLRHRCITPAVVNAFTQYQY